MGIINSLTERPEGYVCIDGEYNPIGYNRAELYVLRIANLLHGRTIDLEEFRALYEMAQSDDPEVLDLLEELINFKLYNFNLIQWQS